MKLSKLKKVDLREVWGHEAIDFTNWLVREENLDLLGNEIGVEIEPLRTEASVGAFKVDILAEEGGTGRKIIIENQLEDTDHDHLGKIISYASGYDAEIIIWVVRDIREEHQRAIEWLNERTDEKTGFFLIKVELWQIESSPPAPKFEIMVSPNEWAKTIKSAPSNAELTDTKLHQLDFWKKFKDFIKSRYPGVSFGQSPRPQHWFNISMGISEAHVALTIDTRKRMLGCEIYINRNKSLFHFLRERRGEIEKEIGEQAEWIDAAVASRIKIKKEVSDVFSQSEAENHFAWLYEKTMLFKEVFGRHSKAFKR